ncbi:MAG: DUF1566 domain-containing protein [Pseudomonadota bacterium]
MSTGIYSVLIIFVLSFSSTLYAQELDANIAMDDAHNAEGIETITETQRKKSLASEVKSINQQKCFDNANSTLKTQSFSVCGNGNLIYDNLTGLMWTRCAIGKSWNSETKECEGDASIYNWKESLNKVVDVNQTGFNAHSDWRLPNIKELASIVDLSCAYPAIDQNVFPNTDNAAFWTSSVFEQYPGRAWYFKFDLGHDYPSDKRYFKQLRFVRLGLGEGSYNLKTGEKSSLLDACASFATIKFDDLSDVPLVSTIQSGQAMINFTGQNNECTVSVENGEYEINSNGIWSSEAGTIKSGESVSVRHISSDQYIGDVITTLSVCDATAMFKSTTMEEVSASYEDVLLDTEILFAYDSSELSDEAKSSIDGYVDQFRDRFDKIAEIVIIGHTDGIASQQYNQKLSERRAQSVASYLEVIEGIPDTEIEAIGKGKLEPIESNDTAEGRAKNRRVVLRLIFK